MNATRRQLLGGALALPLSVHAKHDEPWLRVTISEEEARVIRGYYGGGTNPSQGGLPPGLQKKVARGKGLPPGWQKKMARGYVMEDRIYRHAEILPGVLLGRLPPQPRGTVLIRIEGKIVRLAQATREIIDILDL